VLLARLVAATRSTARVRVKDELGPGGWGRVISLPRSAVFRGHGDVERFAAEAVLAQNVSRLFVRTRERDLGWVLLRLKNRPPTVEWFISSRRVRARIR